MRMRPQMADVIKNDPSVLLSSECEYFVREFSEEKGISRGDVEKSIRDCLHVTRGRGLWFLADVKEGAKDTIMFLGASRCSRALSIQSDILHIVFFSDLDRNRVGSYAKVLEPFGLVNLSGVGRSEVISTTELGDLYSDILLGKMELIKKKLEKSVEEFLQGGDAQHSFQSVEKFETAFDLAKEAYPKNSLNYEVIDDFHDLFVMLNAAIRKGRKRDVEDLSKTIYEALETSARTRLQAERAHLKPLLMEDTGERVGRGRVFRPVRPKS